MIGNQNIPKLRFPGFEGEWKFKKIGNIAELTSSKRVYLTDYVEQGIPFYRGKEISELKLGKIPNDILYITESSYQEFKEKFGVPQKDDLLITAVGTLGNVLRIKDEAKFYFKDGNLIWFRKITEFSPFLEIALDFYKSEIEKTSIGSTQRALTMVELRKLKFPFPTLPEQQKIASFLSAVDEKIQQLSRKKELVEQYKKGVMQQLFSGKLRFKDENRNKYPDWEKKKLGEVITIFNGYAFPSSDSQENGCRWVKIADVGIYEMKEDSLSFLPNEFISRYSKFVLKKGDYVLALTRPILNGKLKIAEIKESFNNSLLNQRVGKLISENHLPFTYYLLQQNHLILKIDSRIAGTDPPNLSPNEIDSIKIKIPINKKEQQKIANYLSSIDAKIENTKGELEKVQLFKKGLLQQLFV